MDMRFKFATAALVLALASIGAHWPINAISHGTQPENTYNAVTALSQEAYVPEGEYIRGCTADTAGIYKCMIESKPLQAVYLDAFLIDKTEVTNAQYAACVAAGGGQPPLSTSSTTRTDYYGNPVYASYPVIHVDWPRADAYCRWAGKRLPTEAEWEKAARGTDHRLFPWGNEAPSCDRANYMQWYLNPVGELREHRCVGDTSPVGGYVDYASPYGVYDMAGNVREWVNDLYLKLYFVEAPYYNPPGPVSTDANEHLAKGGSWDDPITHITSWNRFDEADIYSTHLIGFRCARDATGAVPTPMPTPVPYDAGEVGPEGGALWIETRDHLTLLAVPASVFSSPETVTVTYSVQSNIQGDLQGMGHFFRLDTELDSSAIQATREFSSTVRVVLGYRESGAVVRNTIDLYRVTASGWVTDGITKVAELPGFLVADVTSTGVYGLLGASHRTYLPISLR